MSETPELSVVVPLHNEADVVDRFADELTNVLRSMLTTWEVVLVNDGSADDTGDRIRKMARQESRIVPVELSRKFGKESALAAGLETASGKAVIVMDGDLQHPPALIPEIVQRWRDGADVVNAVKSDRGGERLSYRLAAKVFYILIGAAMGRRLESQSDFKLLDRQVVDQVRGFSEQHRFFRGLVAWVGFQVDEVPFLVHERSAGRSSFGGIRLMRYAVRNLMAFSSGPLQAIAWVGLITTALAAVLAMQTLYNWAAGQAIDGFTTAILVTLILGGVHLVCLGVLAVYQSVMYDELKARPRFIIRNDRSVRTTRSLAIPGHGRARAR